MRNFILLALLALGGTMSARAAMIVTFGDFVSPVVLDFEALPTGPIATNDPYFTAAGITSVTVANGTPGDTLSSNTSGQSLASVGGALAVAAVGGAIDNGTAGGNPIFTIDLAAPTDLFGFSYVDQSGTFPITFFLGAVQVDSFAAAIGSATPVYLRTVAAFDRVTLAQEAGFSGGFGIDNLTFEAQAVPEPSTFFLTLLGVGLVASRRFRRRG